MTRIKANMITTAPQHQMTLGSIRVTYLPDGYALFNPTFLYPTTTLADWQPYQHLLNQDGQILASIGAYSIQTPGHTILVDAGQVSVAYAPVKPRWTTPACLMDQCCPWIYERDHGCKKKGYARNR
jgi:hypothetical protein